MGALLAIVVAAGVALMFTKSEPKTDAAIVPRAARVERVEGEVGIARAFAGEELSEPDWTEATINAPLTVGDRIYAKEGSRATLAFSGRNYARLDPGASLDVLSLADRRTQLALRNGSAIFDLGDLSDEDFFEVATPNGAVEFDEPGLYQLGFDDSGNTLISVLSGLAQVVGLAGSGEIGKGEVLTLLGQTAAQAVVSRIAPDLAGGIVDDYYDYRYDDYDGRYRDYDTYLDDPDYYDPYRRSASYQYVNSYDVPGVYDLDYYGDWTEVDGYGHCWAPRVDAGWAPYRNGSWDVDNVWGPTWVSQEPWGWAPYHYGRWAHVNNQRWVWVPDRTSSRPVYSPALVAFVPLRQTNQIAWVPLAPGEQYIPRYYNASYEPQYIAPVEVVNRYVSVQRTYINMSVPQAVTVVPAQHFTEVIEPGSVSYLNHQYTSQAQPVLDPYAVDSVRQIAMARRGGKFKNRDKFRVGQDFDRVLNTPVVASVAPVVPPTHENFAQAFQVRPASEKQRKNRLKLERNGQVISQQRAGKGVGINYPASSQQTDGSFNAQERGQRKAALKAQAAQGDQTARVELKQLRKQEKQQRRGIIPAGQAVPAQQNQAQVERQTRQERKALRRLDRPQQEVRPGVPQKHGAASQTVNPRKLERQQMRQQRRLQQVQQPAAASQQTQIQQQVRQQRKAQRQAERQQRRMQQPAAVPQQSQQQAQIKQQMRQQRQQQRQMQQMQQRQNVYAAPQAAQQKQSVMTQQTDKAQRRAERRATRQQQAAQQQAAAPQVQRQQQPAAQPAQNDRAQRKAEKAARKAGRGNQ